MYLGFHSRLQLKEKGWVADSQYCMTIPLHINCFVFCFRIAHHMNEVDMAADVEQALSETECELKKVDVRSN